jgi:halimadienyl-diphosphate synthase
MIRFKELLSNMGPGKVSSTAYDTAWIAQLANVDKDISNKAMEWICKNQLPDGSWGANEPFYYHDRLISTLAALIALTCCGRRSQDQKQIERGVQALEEITNYADRGLAADPNGATAGFEMIVPTLLIEAKKYGIIRKTPNRILNQLTHQRQVKLNILKDKKINRFMTAAFSAEMAGIDGQGKLDIDNLQEDDGSVSHSPSATAYYLSKISPEDNKALKYLRAVMDNNGGAPMASPFEICERAWVLWNIGLVDSLDTDVLNLCKPHLDELWNAWKPLSGVGFTRDHSVFDGDDTSVTFDVLTRFGYPIDLETLLEYKEDDHFRCYPLEANFSISTNVHFLGAFRRIGLKIDNPHVQRIIRYIRKTRKEETFWLDKWHTSPYYTTSHVIITCNGYDNGLLENSIEWIIETQRENGGWGYYKNPTAEETAYALQALSLWIRQGKKVDRKILLNGLNWLNDHDEGPYPMLWIAKTLNYSEWIIQATISSAATLAEQAIG